MVEYQGKNVTIMCCSTCNVCCSHCYLGYKGDIFADTLYEIVKNLSKKYSVDLNGSEPLLNIDYLKSFKYIKQNRILTNGLIIHNNYNLLEKMKNNGIEWVGMSYHFNAQKDVSEVDLNIVEDDIKLLKERNFKVELMATVEKNNLYNIEMMVEKAIKLNADCIRFTNYLLLGNAKKMNKKEFVLSQQQINEFFDQFYGAKKKYSNKILVRRSGTFNRDFRKSNSTYYCPARSR